MTLITVMPDPVIQRILLLLEKEQINATSLTCKKFAKLVDFYIWKPKAEELNKKLHTEIKQDTKSWKAIYFELFEIYQNIEKPERNEKTINKVSNVAVGRLGFPKRDSDTHNYPTGQQGYLAGRKITIYRPQP